MLSLLDKAVNVHIVAKRYAERSCDEWQDCLKEDKDKRKEGVEAIDGAFPTLLLKTVHV